MSCDDLIDLAARRKAREVLAFMTATELDDYPFIQNRFTAQGHCQSLRLQVGPDAVPYRRVQWPLSLSRGWNSHGGWLEQPRWGRGWNSCRWPAGTITDMTAWLALKSFGWPARRTGFYGCFVESHADMSSMLSTVRNVHDR